MTTVYDGPGAVDKTLKKKRQQLSCQAVPGSFRRRCARPLSFLLFMCFKSCFVARQRPACKPCQRISSTCVEPALSMLVVEANRVNTKRLLLDVWLFEAVFSATGL